MEVGQKIKQARTDAGFTQAQLADLIRGLSASDISKAERGEKELERDQLIAIAKATGVTQKSLLEAAGTKKSTTAKKTTTTTKKTGTTTKKTSATKKTTTPSSGTSMKVTTTERKLVERYREADSKTKKLVNDILKGGKNDLKEAESLLSNLIGDAVDALFKG